MITRLIWIASLALLLTAQEFRGTILGRITDSTGAAVPNAGVEALNVETQTVAKSVSNAEGNYQIPFLLPGNYTVVVQAAGFKKVDRTNVRVSTGNMVTVDIALEVGATSESVTVTAAVPLLEVANGDLSQVMTRQYVQSIEFSTDRNIGSLAVLAPGVTGNEGGTYTASTHAQISINGGGGTRGSNEYLIDGIPNTAAGGAPVFLPSIDSVDEFKVHTTMFDASLGHTNGGAISITTRGGTNELHGTGYWYNRSTGLQANSWNNNRVGNPRPPTKYDQLGYLISGPVYLPILYDGRNRTFFTTSLEKDNDKRNLTPLFRVPTALERQGDFSQTLNRLGGRLTIYDPATTVVSGTRVTRQPFPGNRIPADRITASGRAIMNNFPLPTIEGQAQIGRQNWSPGGYYAVKQGNLIVRGDHNISDNQRVFARLGRATRDNAPGQEFYRGYAGGNVGVGFTTYTNFGLDDTITFSPSLVGTVRLGLVRRAGKSRIGGDGYDPKEWSLPNVVISNQFFPGWPTIAMGESFPATASRQSKDASDMYSLTSTFNKLTGPLSMKFGTDYRLQRWNTLNPGDPSYGSFTFSNAFTTADPFVRTSGDTSGTSMASLLLGLPASGSFGYVSPLSTQNHYFAMFTQNDWKATRKLTLNFGLRWEFETPFTERYNRISYGFDENAALPLQVPGMSLRGGLLFAGANGNSRAGGPLDMNNFGPRFGFAYQLESKTVVRGGYGLFYSLISNNDTFRSNVDAFNAVTSFVGTTDGGATVANTLANPFPQGLRTPVGADAGLLASVGDSLSFFDLKRVMPYSQQWQFSIQRELPSKILAEAAYVGVLSLKGIDDYNLNEKPDQYLALGTAENTQVPNPFYRVFPATSTLGAAPTIAQGRLWSRFPQFTSLTIRGANTNKSIYHALQTKVDKRMTHGLSVLFSYTWSKIMTNNMTSLINERHYRTVGEFDQEHLMRSAIVYDMPVRFRGTGLGNRILDGVLGGWRLSTHLRFATGQPMSVSHANGRPIRIKDPGLSGSNSDRLGDKRDASGRVLNPFFDVTAFQPLPNQFTVTPEPPFLDDLREPALWFTNAQLFKAFHITERVRLEYNFQADNALNSPQWDPPGANMSNAATFGVIQGATNWRTVMTSLRVRF